MYYIIILKIYISILRGSIDGHPVFNKKKRMEIINKEILMMEEYTSILYFVYTV